MEARHECHEVKIDGPIGNPACLLTYLERPWCVSKVALSWWDPRTASRTCDVGSDGATPVSDDYGARDSEFTGQVRWVQIDIDEAGEDVDHLIGPEERLRIAMARQ